MKSENGQSLFECLLIIPIFFLVLSGFNLYLNQKIKSLTDQSAFESLQITDALFDDEERIRSEWVNFNLNSKQYSELILSQSYNPSSYFFRSVDLKNDVFVDKRRVLQTNEHSCSSKTNYSPKTLTAEEFEFFTCSGSKGYESIGFNYENFHQKFHALKTKYKGQSIYSPKGEYLWQKRQKLVSDAVSQFSHSLEGVKFSNIYASSSAMNHAQFNSQCFMNPYAPPCSRPSLSEKWREATYHAANEQVFACFTEMSVGCAKYTLPSAVAGCLAKGLENIAFSLSSGRQALVCPFLNRVIEGKYKSIIGLSFTNFP